ncbi:hypothetical protein CEXT_557461 [Caerostris extrusa]|uniref:Uncharacterized protein n=1 Tax=Caerostris extrusa TaxID=172846 RepID=A0AAV4T4Z9_CAEEX|nr:hypothetical protein CEXT_557461 [Caerostris extrusa]
MNLVKNQLALYTGDEETKSKSFEKEKKKSVHPCPALRNSFNPLLVLYPLLEIKYQYLLQNTTFLNITGNLYKHSNNMEPTLNFVVSEKGKKENMIPKAFFTGDVHLEDEFLGS